MQTAGTININSQTVGASVPTHTRAASRANMLVAILLFAAMIVGGYFRFVGLNWDDFTHLHPDERFLTDVAQGLGYRLSPSDSGADAITPQEQVALCVERYPATGGLGSYFDALCSPYNPHNANPGHGMYVYGTLPLFMAIGTAEAVIPISEWWAHNISVQSDPTMSEYTGSQWRTYDGIHLIWRYLSALAETAIVLVAFCIGLRLHNKWVGLIAAWLYAATVFSIQLGHFATTDAISNMFTAVTILFAVCVQRQGKLRDYVLFGVFFGFALASRINLLPLVGLIFLAAILQVIPAFDRHALPGIREKLISKHFFGLVLAGLATIIAFRLTNPYAFMGPGIFGLTPNPRFLQDLATAQSLVSGQADSPPNFQWASRTSYVFPWWNMVMWGMGLPLGLTAWAAFVWAIVRIFRGKKGATLNILLLAWIAVYFGYMGRNWVMTMRYFIPLYSSLVVLAAWAMYTLIQNARVKALAKGITGFTLRKGVAWGLLVGVVGFTLLWAAMYTNVYRNLLTRVQAGWWVWDNVPGDFSMRVETPDGNGDALVSMNHGQYETREIPLINIDVPNRYGADPDDLVNKVTRYDESSPTSSERFTAPATGVIRSIFAPHLGDPLDDPENEVLQIQITTTDGEVVATATINQNLTRDTHITGDPLEIMLDEPLEVQAGDEFNFNVELISGGPVISGGTIFTWEGAWDDPVPAKVCTPPDGVTLADDPPPGLINDGRSCDGRDPWWGFVNGYEQDIVYEDGPEKLEALLRSLDDSDYIAISSNRFYDTLNRNTLRWPLTNEYYRALFAGELGYDLVATFQETYELGPLRVSDQYLPTYNGYRGGDLFNEFESEEAFSVYDHPVVFIFQRGENYDPAQVREILGAIPLARVYDASPYNSCPEDMDLYYCNLQLAGIQTWSTEEADEAPTALMLTPQDLQTQQQGGTWSERFDSSSLINTNMIVSVAAWYGAIFLFGLIAFPLLFALFPRLSDRGYAFAKFAGIFMVSFVVWVLASLKIPVWSQTGIIGAMIALALFSVWVWWRKRAEFGTWLKSHWKRLALIEIITLVLYLIMVGYRLINPDLWHDSFGGEKPMDFAYFNAVLRSTVFPAYDPWYAGGFINYYYYGFVIVGTPVLLLKMLPSIAFNLILPTLFALTGIGAFSVAFTAAEAFAHKLPDGRIRKLGSPWLAGIAALVMCVFLGNLDTPRVALTALANAGGYSQPRGLSQFLIDEYTRQHDGTPPDDATMITLFEQADANNPLDRLRYELSVFGDQASSVINGIGRVIGGQELYVSPDRWFWGPSRVLAETPGVEGQAITEMPAFTFIYADMHAHMISLPMQMLIFAFLLNEVLLAGRDTRRRRVQFAALVLGAIVVGMLRATNTWDWITYMVLCVAGLSFAWWLKWKSIRRASVNDYIVRIGGFVAITFIATLPYTTWYSSTYNSIRLWTDGKTPLWAYFDIHGLFLFLILSFLVWDTGRWLHSVAVKTLRGTWALLIAALFIIAAIIVGALLLASASYQVTLVALPMILWVGMLFFRQGQSRIMQFLLALVGLALALTLGVEYIVLDGDIGRQNTVFKFYIQVWLMFSIVGGVALSILWTASERWRWFIRVPWTVILVGLIAIASLFPVMAARGKATFRMDTVTNADGTKAEYPLTLDGMEFMTLARRYEGDSDVSAVHPDRMPFELADDYAMIRWLQENVQGSPTIIEGLGDDTQYRWNSRISIYTGLPAVQGWNFHQRQQRTLDPFGRMVEFRNANVNAFYETANIAAAWQILQHYNVEYVIVGNLERAYTGDVGLAKFPEMVELGLLEPVFESGDSTIYRVNHAADFDAAQLDVG